MSKRRNVPFFEPSPEPDRRSQIMDGSPLIENQFHRPPKDGQPMGPSQDIRVERTFGWETKYRRDHDD